MRSSLNDSAKWQSRYWGAKQLAKFRVVRSDNDHRGGTGQLAQDSQGGGVALDGVGAAQHLIDQAEKRRSVGLGLVQHM